MNIISQTPSNAVIRYTTPLHSCEILYDFTGTSTDLAPLFQGSLWTCYLWEKSVRAACSFLSSHADWVRGKRVCELGCSAGVPGTLCALLGAERVWLTDKTKEDLFVPVRTLRENMGEFGRLGMGEDVVRCRAWDWEAQDDGEMKAEVIIACECVSREEYGEESLDGLVKAIIKVGLGGRRSKVVICSARRGDDGLDYVLDLLREKTGNPVLLVSKDERTGVELYFGEC